MTFNSLLFFVFLFVVWGTVGVLLRYRTLALVFRGISRWRALQVRNAFLLVASYVFYGAWDLRFLSLIAFSTLADYVAGRAIGSSVEPRVKRRWLLFSLVSNLGLLAVFKYLDFFSQGLADLLGAFGWSVDPVLLDIVLPVGISFYTFQTLSYTIDVYRGNLAAERNLLSFSVFVAFFPQLVAGPIERAKDLLPQFRRTRLITRHRVESGAFLVFSGLFKKVVIADNVAHVVDNAFGLAQPDAVQVLCGVYGFAVQIYCDFSGYTDIARGAARLVGFELSRNFDLPYFARNPSEFWRRWHISLSSWLRDYLYVSLGGNRQGSARTYVNLMLTMLLGGLWHGAAWTYVAWGAFHGALLGLHRFLRPSLQRLSNALGPASWLSSVVSVLVFFQLTALGWLFFRAETLSQVWNMLGQVVVPVEDWEASLDALGPWKLALIVATPLVLVQFLQYFSKSHWVLWTFPMPLRAFGYAAGLLMFVWLGEDHEIPFVYFQF